jgi:hypothetical protein
MLGRFKSSINVRKLDAPTGGSLGIVAICTTSVTAAIAVAIRKAARQPELGADIGAGGCGRDGRDRDAGQDHGHGARKQAHRRKAHGECRRRRPEAAERDAEQNTRREQLEKPGRGRGDQVGQNQQEGEGPQHQPAVDRPGDDRERRRGDGADYRGRRDRLAGGAVGNAEIGGDRREQARRQELGRHQAEHAERQRYDRWPQRLGALFGGRGEVAAVRRQGQIGVESGRSIGHRVSPGGTVSRWT